MSVVPFSGFYPFFGSRYWQGRRPWVLGESHYGAPTDRHEAFTADTVAYWTQAAPERASRRGLFWRVARLLHDCDPRTRPPVDLLRTTFQEILFSNFVQDIVGEGPGIRPTQAMWATGAPVFPVTLDCFDPELILVIGQATWDHLPRASRESTVLLEDGLAAPVRWYAAPGGLVPAMHIHHTAAVGWRYEQWRPVVRALLSLEGWGTYPVATAPSLHF
jgi:hypothetical protein